MLVKSLGRELSPRNSVSISGSSSTTRTEGSCSSSRSGKGACGAGQNDPKFRELVWLRLDLDRPAMLFDDDIVAQREAKAGSLAGGFCRKKRIEHLFLHLERNAGAVVADSNFDAVTKIPGRGNDGGLVACTGFRLALGRRVEAVRDQVKQHPRDLLREKHGLACGRIKGALQSDIESRFLGPRSVIGQIEALLDEGVDIDTPGLSRSMARVQQHVFDDAIRALAVLHDLFEVAS